MSKPLTADQLISAFKKWGVKYEETPGWRTHNRNGVGAWGPVNGLLLHHTGDDAPDSADQRVLWNGRSDLPGPLCSWGQRDDGTTVLIGNGRANHAGSGSASTLSKVINENYSGNITPGPDGVDGNSHLYGQETMYSGGHRMTDAAYHNTLLTFAAVCDAHGWSAKSAIGHKEWTRRKPDPGHLDMATFRADLQKVLDAGPQGSKTPATPSKPKPKPTPAPLPIIAPLDLAGKTISKLPVVAHARLCLDWSWAKPNFHTMSADPRVRGVARYLSPDKNKTISDLERVLLHAEGFWITFVYEEGKTPLERQRRPLAGTAAGVADAKAADAFADALGVPDDVAIAHPVDSDLSFAAVRAYWEGIHSVARRPRMVYGGADIVDSVVSSGMAKYGWQTTSWSQVGGKLRVAKRANLLQLHGSFRPAGAEIKGLAPNDYDPNLILKGPAIPVWNPGEPKRTPGKSPTVTPEPVPVPPSKTSLKVGTFNWQGTDKENDQFGTFRNQADLWGLCEVSSVWQRLKIKLMPNGWDVWPVTGTAASVPIVWRKSRLSAKSKLSFKAGDSEAGVSPQRHVNEIAFDDLLTKKSFTHDHGHAPHHFESKGVQMVYKGADVTKFARQPARAKAFFDVLLSRVQSVLGPLVATGDWNVDYHAEKRVPAANRVPWFPLTQIVGQPGMKAQMPPGPTHNDGRAIDWTVTRGMRVLGQHTILPPAGADPAVTSDHYPVITEVEI